MSPTLLRRLRPRLRPRQVLGEPVEALAQAVARRGAARLDVPTAAAEFVEAQALRELGRRHGAREVLLVREDQQPRIAQRSLGQHAVKHFFGFRDAVAVVGVHDEHDGLRVLVVVAPERADLVLAADVPHRQREGLVVDGLDVEADGRDGRDDLAQLEPVENRRLACGVEADHENPRFHLLHKCLNCQIKHTFQSRRLCNWTRYPLVDALCAISRRRDDEQIVIVFPRNSERGNRAVDVHCAVVDYILLKLT
mmetsp:Transcript_5216/g.16452  ORF Transcript_5216/g.16452 Transcript_5216/m.16452 type:complete len:252 (+) Transcript_5216:9-764(+)